MSPLETSIAQLNEDEKINLGFFVYIRHILDIMAGDTAESKEDLLSNVRGIGVVEKAQRRFPHIVPPLMGTVEDRRKFILETMHTLWY